MKIPKFWKRSLIVVGVVSVLFLGGRFAIKQTMGEDALNIINGIFLQIIGKEAPDYAQSQDYFTPNSQQITLDKSIKPFREIGKTLGDAAKGNNFILSRGTTIFDANGDGRLDLFLAHSGRPMAKASNEDGVLQPNQPVDAKPCVLYLNMGNDENGDPIYQSVPELIAEQTNPTQVEGELLTENKYKARTSIDESPFEVGRIAIGATAADFNGDGRVDLLVLNSHYGMPFVHVDYGMKVFPPSENIGRGHSNKKFIRTSLPPYLAGDMEDGMHKTVNFGGKTEPEGRNTLYLNMGDQDQDGIPEWQDATESSGMDQANWSSMSACVGDVDRDGDLDIYVSNFLDPDFWAFGRRHFGGNPNELWINQLSESGEFSFIEQAAAFGVEGMHHSDSLPSSMWDRKNQELFDDSDHFFDGKRIGEKADHTWTSQFLDYDNDGWPDLFVANDIGNRLRVYKNMEGKGFQALDQFHDPVWNGSWMGFASGDLNGDLKDEVMISNFGTQSVSLRNTAILTDNPEEINIGSLQVRNYIDGKASAHNTVMTVSEDLALTDITAKVQVQHSPYISPDAARRENCADDAQKLFDQFKYDESIAGIEFAWNQIFFDLDNDGDLDIYSVGSLSRGNDDFFGEVTSSPGRLLINEGQNLEYSFVDKTLEYQVLDISELDYSTNPPRRASPGTNWHKRDYVSLQDLDSYAEMGLEASQKSRIKDIFRMHESANNVVNADLNNDGFQDMVVCHAGGNNSNLPSARNLKVEIMGKVMAMPPPNKVIKAPTNFEEGPTFMYINQGAPEGKAGNWVSIALEDTESHNPHGVGAKIIANDSIMRRNTVGGQTFSATHVPIHVGLGSAGLEKVEIYWGSGDTQPQIVHFNPPIRNQSIRIKREQTQPTAGL